jgi:hypothetical protein
MRIAGWFLVFVACNNFAWLSAYETVNRKYKREVSLYDDAMKEPSKTQHHYRFEMRGASTWRFDDMTGSACMITSSQAEASLWNTMQCRTGGDSN